MAARWTMTAAGVVLAGIIGVATVQAGEIVERERRQQDRIGQGVQSGELTAKETQRLEREQVRIENDRRQALADGKMTKRERARLHNEQDRASHRIYRQKHDAQRQPGAQEAPAAADYSWRPPCRAALTLPGKGARLERTGRESLRCRPMSH